MTSIAIVTPWRNHPELWDDYRAAVTPELNEGDELIIVDDASDPPLENATVRTEKRLGFCGASNLGLYRATADAVLFLNNDIHAAQPGWLNDLRDAVQPGRLVGPISYASHTRVDSTMYPFVVGWACCGMRDDLLEIGGFDDTLAEPAYYSDNILCLDARLAGMSLVGVNVRLQHKEGTTARDDSTMLAASGKNRDAYIRRVRAATRRQPR